MTVHWTDGRLIGLDLETTSPKPEDARIVTAAIVEVGGGQERRDHAWLVNPGVEIPDEAAAIHGVTTEKARANGAAAAEAVCAILDTLVVAGVAVDPLVIFNARYDLTVLERERARHGVDHPPLTTWPRLRVVDPLVLDRHLDRYRKGSRQLDAQAEHYGAVLDDAHDATSDALTACRLAWCIGRRGKVIRRVRGAQDGREKAALTREWETVRDDLNLLHAAQARWAHMEALRLAEYFRSVGKHDDAAGVRPEWPIVPPPVT